MFKKYSRIENQGERLGVFNLLKLNLAICLVLSELLGLTVLTSGLAWLLGSRLTTALGGHLGPVAAIGLMLLGLVLVRWPFLYASGQLQADFGLDLRPAGQRFKALLQSSWRWFGLAWLGSVGLFFGLVHLSLWGWSALIFVSGLILIVVDTRYPQVMRPDRRRTLRPGELSPQLMTTLEKWSDKTGLKTEAVEVSTSCQPELGLPRLVGLGSTLRLVIPEKALTAFNARALSLLVATAAIGALIQAPLKLLFLRLCSLAVSIPLAAILISTLGVKLWGYPFIFNPALIVLVWVALWIGWGLTAFTLRLTGRSLDIKLAVVAMGVLKDDEALEMVVKTLAANNLEEEKPPAWLEMFRRRFTGKEFLKQARYHQHLSSFKD